MRMSNDAATVDGYQACLLVRSGSKSSSETGHVTVVGECRGDHLGDLCTAESGCHSLASLLG